MSNLRIVISCKKNRMRHFIQYHNAKLMGYSANRIKATEIFTNQPVNQSSGHTVWVVSGEGTGNKKAFFLAAAFNAKSFEERTYKHEKFKNSVAGDGELYGLSLALDWKDWFTDFQKRSQFQSRGFHALNEDDPVIKEFQKLSGYLPV